MTSVFVIAGKRKPGGSTPTTIRRVGPSCMDRVSARGSDPSRVRQNSWLTITTGAALSRASSDLQQSAKRRLDAQRVERVGRDGGALDAERLTVAEQRGLESVEARQRLERTLALTQVDEVTDRDVRFGETGLHVPVPEHDELAGSFERKRPQQRGFDDGEQCGVRADPEREGRTAAAAKAGSRRKIRSA